MSHFYSQHSQRSQILVELEKLFQENERLYKTIKELHKQRELMEQQIRELQSIKDNMRTSGC